MKTPITLILMALAAASMLNGCSRQKPPTTSNYLTGTLSYQTPVNFESPATLELMLTDVSVSDGPAVVVAKLTVNDLHTLPYSYSLPYDAAKIDARHRYTVDARIFSSGKVRFSTDTAYGVLIQGNHNQRDIMLVAVGENAGMPITDTGSDSGIRIFQNELRTGQEISLYKAGLQNDHILWLEEDRSNGRPQPLHTRYEFKGALIMHYVDTSPLEISFDERGRATGMVKNRKALRPDEHINDINEIRNRAELLRSHALASSEIQAHRQATGG
ncbi:MAG: YbaY family lipoprotein [Steroidobacteraceae bacterium]